MFIAGAPAQLLLQQKHQSSSASSGSSSILCFKEILIWFFRVGLILDIWRRSHQIDSRCRYQLLFFKPQLSAIPQNRSIGRVKSPIFPRSIQGPYESELFVFVHERESDRKAQINRSAPPRPCHDKSQRKSWPDDASTPASIFQPS